MIDPKGLYFMFLNWLHANCSEQVNFSGANHYGGLSFGSTHSNKILIIQEGYARGVSSIGKPRPTSTGIWTFTPPKLPWGQKRPQNHLV